MQKDTYSCINSSEKITGKGLLCIRSIAYESIDDYKTQYGLELNQKENEYLSLALSCAHREGHARRLVNTTLPPQLYNIGNFELGYKLTQVNASGDKISVQHGFASPVGGLEYIGDLEYLWFAYSDSGYEQSELDKKFNSGPFDILLDDTQAFESIVNKDLALRGAAIDITGFEIINNSSNKYSLNQKNDLLDGIFENVTRAFRNSEFEEIGPHEIESVLGMSKDELVNGIMSQTPEGLRNTGAISKIRDIAVLSDQYENSCTASDNGFFLGVVTSTEPEEFVKSDLGSLNTMVLGIGHCMEELSNVGLSIENEVLDEIDAYLRQR